MLVDCNDSQIGAVGDEGAGHSTTETKTGAGPLDEALSGTTMMGRCWRKIVGLEVAKVLCQLGAWDAPHSVAVEILQLYNRLKHGMLELFGGHAQFALALKEGFSKALQGLNEVEGVKVRGNAPSGDMLKGISLHVYKVLFLEHLSGHVVCIPKLVLVLFQDCCNWYLHTCTF